MRPRRFLDLNRWLRLHGLGQLCQTGNFSGSCAFVQNAFFGSFIDGRLGRFKICVYRIGGIFRNSLTNLFYNGLNTGFDRSVAHTANFILAGAFECRFVVGQWSTPFKGLR